MRVSATPDLRLPSRPRGAAPWPVPISPHAEVRRLSWPELWLYTKTVCPRTVTYPSTNRAGCRVTSLMGPTTLSVDQTSVIRSARVSVGRMDAVDLLKWLRI